MFPGLHQGWPHQSWPPLPPERKLAPADAAVLIASASVGMWLAVIALCLAAWRV